MHDAPWYKRFFGEDYLRAYGPFFSQMHPEKDVEFLIERLGLQPGMRVLDLCCGQGRHAIPLAMRGLKVTGQDLSPELIAHSERAARTAGVSLELVRRDMREIPWTAEFDAIVNLYTAFGYFEDDRDNFRVLEGVAGALKPGGRFCIDLVHAAWLFRVWQQLGWSKGEGELMVLQERRMDWMASAQVTDWTFIGEGTHRTKLTTRLRIFPPHELADWLRRAGLEVEGLFGGFDGSPLGVESQRLIAIARKT